MGQAELERLGRLREGELQEGWVGVRVAEDPDMEQGVEAEY